MDPFEFVGLPSRAIFGAGKIATLKEEIEALGAKRALFCGALYSRYLRIRFLTLITLKHIIIA